MKIYIDINHPAHVHYFRNFIFIMQQKGHRFIVSNRDEFIINYLLDYYDIEHSIRSKRPEHNSFLKGLLYLFRIIIHVLKLSIRERPDIYLGFGASACAISSFIFRKPCVIIDDTEHNKLNHRLYRRFCSQILTPFYFEKKMGRKQGYFNAYVEQFYLRSGYYKKCDSVLSELHLDANKYILVRYIAYDAQHDRKANPLSDEMKKKIVTEMSRHYKVIVSCEKSIKDEFYAPYLVNVPPSKMHDLIANARFLISEGATMACEAGLLGTPYLYINPLNVGNINMQEQLYPHACQCIDEKTILSTCNRQLSVAWTEAQRQEARTRIEQNTIDPTQMLVDIFSDENRLEVVK